MKILFMCTHNSCRSILSEALFNHLAPAGFSAVSSGSHPCGRVNQRALDTLAAAGIVTEGLSSKASDTFAQNPPDIVITVCDNAAGEACPLYFGTALKAHWGLVDPSALTGSETEIQTAFDQCLAKIAERVQAFFALPFTTLKVSEFSLELDRIGRL
ncbi:arsenate reductase ArsC [Denitrificimonas sp. JX-1]|uniref:Arsenate reductase ArsC n=1 Tax=Denitrificimonas halotolerans TaxID=3098930 RepID=A0ABU5GQK1_9GAMM|nr:arsenate reductase ArsC [Denitrificimonas sp. JX-1]MDY7219260.1 arsenate reductase ArsC [Denitrificimonas sp. JX-1]